MENKTYTEEDLNTLVNLIDDAYRPHTRNNYLGIEILEEFLKNGGKETKTEEKEIPITYGLIKATCGWSKFAETCNRNVYAIKEFGDYEDREVFYITESQAKQLN